MASIKIIGTVVNHANYKENDRMLTIMSPSMGMVSVKSRSCKKPKSPLLQASELFVTGEFVIYQSSNRQTLTSANIENSFFNIRLDHFKLACGTFILQLCQAAIQEQEECHGVYNNMLKALETLNQNNSVEPITAVNAFIFPFIIFTGYKPRIKHCISCQARIGTNVEVYFDIQNGGCVCQNCKTDNIETLQAEEYAELVRMVDSQTYQKAIQTSANIKTQKKLFYLLCRYLEIQLGQKFKSAKFIINS